MTDDRPPTDPAAVHRGLLAIARNREADFNAILLQYAIERLLDGGFVLPALHAAAGSGQSPGLWMPASGWRPNR